MSDPAKPPSRWFPRALVVLTVLVCLGVGGYAGQVWWARRMAEDIITTTFSIPGFNLVQPGLDLDWPHSLKKEWGDVPWYGRFGCFGVNFHTIQKKAIMGRPASGVIGTTHSSPYIHLNSWVWHPRRTYFEVLKLMTGESLPNDPSAWETWFETHPDLVWDEKRKRLVEPKP